MHSRHRGFTLLEILIVLALIGLIATIILPALKRTPKFAMMNSIQALSTQMTLAYDNAIFTERTHRIVFDVKHGRFWTEIAPSDFTGRAPILAEETESRQKLKDSLYQKLAREAQSARATETPLLEIPAHEKNALKPLVWDKLKTSLIEPQILGHNVVFAQVSTNLSKNKVEFPLSFDPKTEIKGEELDEKYLAYVYFFSTGMTTSASFQIGFRDRSVIDANAPKYTLNLHTLTGRMQLLEGFQEANFVLPK